MKFNLKSKKMWVAISVIGVLFVGGIYIYNKEKKNTVLEEIIPENIVEMYYIPDAEKVYVNGKITPKNAKSFFKDPTLGELEKINVTQGQYVEKGHTLYTYKNKEKESEVVEDEKNLKSLNTDLANLKKNSTENIEEIKILEKEIKDLKSKISKTTSEIRTNIKSSFDGFVHIEKESDVDDNTKPFIRVQSKDFYIEGNVSERDLLKLKVGMDADIHVFSTDEDRLGVIKEISKIPTDASDESSGSSGSLSMYPVILEFKSNAGLVSGFNVQAKINISEVNIEIPSSAVMTEGDSQYVLIDNEGVATKTLVTTESTSDESMLKILSGVEPGQALIQDIESSKLQDGDLINPLIDGSSEDYVVHITNTASFDGGVHIE